MTQSERIARMAAIKEEKAALDRELEGLKKNCTHVHADGSSAIQSSSWMIECTICGQGSID